MSFEKVWLIPLCTTMCSVAAFFLSYMIAVSNGHVTKFWPYISDSGAMPPESCIFGQLLNLAALFLAATVYLRHRQIVEFYWHRLKQVGRWRTVSCVLLWVGYTSAFGISMVANFQENNVLSVHYFGALLAFGCGLIYAWAQTVFSYSMNPKLASPIVSHYRLALCICSTLLFFMTVIFGPILGHQPARNTDIDPKTHCKDLYIWSGDEDNYYEHTVGTVSEWGLAICFQLYILSFVVELRHAYCHAPKLRLIAFCEEDSETGMAITQATLDIHRKLSRKGINCVTVPASASDAFDIDAGGIRGGFDGADDSDVQIWIRAPGTLARLGRLRRNQSDAYLQSSHFRKTAAASPKRTTTVAHCPPYVEAISPMRDSGFLDASARNSADNLRLSPSLLKASPPAISANCDAITIAKTPEKGRDTVAPPFARPFSTTPPQPPPRLTPPPPPPQSQVQPQVLNVETLERMPEDAEFAEVSLVDERDLSASAATARGALILMQTD